MIKKVTQNLHAKHKKVTQLFSALHFMAISTNSFIYLMLWKCHATLYTPEILNTNIEQEQVGMAISLTHNEQTFLSFYESIDTKGLEKILSDYQTTGPRGYTTSLILCRILKIKERICSDRDLCKKIAINPIYRQAVGLTGENLPAHNTFHTLRQRLGPNGFIRIHHHFVQQASSLGLLVPPLNNLPEMLAGKIILIGDSTFLIATASTKGEKNHDGHWLFTDDSVAFGKPHHKHKYPVGHRAHTLMTVNGIPLVSLIAPANIIDEKQIFHLLQALVERYPSFSFGSIMLDAGYDSEELHRDIYTIYNIIPVIIRMPSIKYGSGYSQQGTPLCPFGSYPTRRKGIEYNHQRTKYSCYHACKKDPQQRLIPCQYETSKSRFGWMTYTRFKDGYRKFGPAVPGSRIYERLKPLRTGIERFYGLAKENRYRMEKTNTYMGHDNVLIHVIEHDIVLTLDIMYEFLKSGKKSDVLKI